MSIERAFVHYADKYAYYSNGNTAAWGSTYIIQITDYLGI